MSPMLESLKAESHHDSKSVQDDKSDSLAQPKHKVMVTRIPTYGSHLNGHGNHHHKLERQKQQSDSTPGQMPSKVQGNIPSRVVGESASDQNSPWTKKDNHLQNRLKDVKKVDHKVMHNNTSQKDTLKNSKKVSNDFGSRARLQIPKIMSSVYHRNTTSTSTVAHPDMPQSSPNESAVEAVSKHQLAPISHMTKLERQQLKSDKQEVANDLNLKESCSLFFKQATNPILQPVPVCGSKDYPTHTVHCYQSSISYQRSRSLKPINTQATPEIGNVTTAKTVAMHLGVTCTFQNVAVNGQNVMQALRDCARNCDVRSSKSLFLLDSKQTLCPIPTISLLMNRTNEHDYTRNFVQELLMLNGRKRLNPSMCDRWVNKTALFFIANEPYNVYFQFLTYYNVFNTMNLLSTSKLPAFRDRQFNHGKVPVSDSLGLVVVRLSDATDYRFGEFEQNLFPQLTTVNHLDTSSNASGAEDSNNITCFKRIVKVPWAYSALPFQYVVDSQLKSRYLECYNTSRKLAIQSKQRGQVIAEQTNQMTSTNKVKQQKQRRGINIKGTQNVVPSMISFRSLVLSSCGIKDGIPKHSQANVGGNLRSPLSGSKPAERKLPPLNVVIIKRKPYLRHGLDHPNFFQRMLSNEAELIATLMEMDFLHLTSVYMEEMDICDQVSLAHGSDILIGVHGAGLVHSWWMKDGGVLLELVPPSKLDRPTYKVLASLTGIKYYSVVLEDEVQKHHSNVNISTVVETLGRIATELTVAATP